MYNLFCVKMNNNFQEVNSLVDRKENEQIPILCLEGLVTQKCEENSGVVKGKGAKAGTFNSSFFKKGHVCTQTVVIVFSFLKKKNHHLNKN